MKILSKLIFLVIFLALFFFGIKVLLYMGGGYRLGMITIGLILVIILAAVGIRIYQKKQGK